MYRDTVDFDPGVSVFNLTSNGNSDFFIQKLDASGNFIWTKSIGGVDKDASFSLHIDASENLYLTGDYSDTVDFDPGLATFNLNGQGIFILKLKECTPTTGTDVQTACNAYIWIDGNTYTASNNTASFTLVDGSASGCDSIVTLDLTIETVDATVTATDSSITANTTVASYQWLDCSNGFAIITGETNQTFTATADGNYAVAVTQNGCTDTSTCNAILITGVSEKDFSTALTISPNPTTGQLTVDLGATRSSVTITVRNLMGQLLSSTDYETATKVSLAIEGAPGVYFVQVQSYDGNIATFKIMKQ